MAAFFLALHRVGCDKILRSACSRISFFSYHFLFLQCGRFQPLKDFDGFKKTCRRKLELHNTQRKRKRDLESGHRRQNPLESTPSLDRGERAQTLAQGIGKSPSDNVPSSSNDLQMQPRTIIKAEVGVHIALPFGSGMFMPCSPVVPPMAEDEMPAASDPRPMCEDVILDEMEIDRLLSYVDGRDRLETDIAVGGAIGGGTNESAGQVPAVWGGNLPPIVDMYTRNMVMKPSGSFEIPGIPLSPVVCPPARRPTALAAPEVERLLESQLSNASYNLFKVPLSELPPDVRDALIALAHLQAKKISK